MEPICAIVKPLYIEYGRSAIMNGIPYDGYSNPCELWKNNLCLTDYVTCAEKLIGLPWMENYFGFFFCVLGFFLDSVLWGVLFACSMAPTGVFLGFHSFSRVLNVFWVFSWFFTGFFGFERFCFVLAVFGRVSRDLHTSDH